MIDLKDWNDINTKEIPIDIEVFALLDDDLKPYVIIPRIRKANTLRWTSDKDKQHKNLVLCYDIPHCNIMSCKGSDIRYWKNVNKPEYCINDKQLIEKIKNIKEFDSYEKYYLTDLCRSNMKGE